jgi:nucleoside-diphosphate-sugar epimerase
MRLLVTGATGFIGRRLVPAALAAGHETVLLLRGHHRDGRDLPAPLAGLPAVYADLRDSEATRQAVATAMPEAVLHLAAMGVTAPFLPAEEAVAHNVLGTIHLVEASVETAWRLVVARTPGEREALNVYAASKAAAWQFCRMAVRTRGLPVVGAMIFQAYGPGQTGHNLIPAAMAAARAGADFAMTPGSQVRDWIYVDDVVEGLLATLCRPLPAGATVELGTGLGTSVAAVVERIYALCGSGGRPLPGALPPRPGESIRQIADAESARELLGWEARTSLDEGLRRLL